MTHIGEAIERVEGIVIGASAGGIEALSALLPVLPAGLRAAVCVVLHLPRERRSLLVEIFTQRCALKVVEAEDKQPLEGGTVYFAPPDYHMLLDRGPIVSLSTDEPVNYSRPSIDVLFESAADLFLERLLGIVLTGGNHDGAAGLEAVLRGGGVAIVQDPASAQASYMPAAALRRNPGANVMTLEQMTAMFRNWPLAATPAGTLRPRREIGGIA